MGDYRMDDDDRALAALFAHPPLADDGFSERVTQRIRRRERLRRYVLPVAVIAGALFAFKPLFALTAGLASLLQTLLASVSLSSYVAPALPALPELPALPLAADWLPWAVLALAIGATSVRLLED